jgi:hypothetical protein
MKKRGQKMDAKLGAEWVAFATKKPIAEVVEHFNDDQLVILGKWLSGNKLLNPPKKPARKRTGVFLCKCGCGTRFTAEYTTKKPQFLNDAHKMRYQRSKQKWEGESS